MFFELICPEVSNLFLSCLLIWISLSFILAFTFFRGDNPSEASEKGVKTAGVVALIILVICLLVFHINDCQGLDFHSHADDCQCNECVINRCKTINHGDTCECDECISCKDIGIGGN